MKNDNFLRVYQSTLNLPISQDAKLVYAYLDHQPLTITHHTLAVRLGFSVRKLTRNVKALRKAGYVDIHENPGKANTYDPKVPAEGAFVKLPCTLMLANVSSAAKLQYAQILAYSNMGSRCHARQATMADALGVSARTVSRTTTELVKAGLLEVRKGSKALHQTNRYKVKDVITGEAVSEPVRRERRTKESRPALKVVNDGRKGPLLAKPVLPCDDKVYEETEGKSGAILNATAPWLIHVDGSPFAPRDFVEAFQIYCKITGRPVRNESITEDMMLIPEDPEDALCRLLLMHWAALDPNNKLYTAWNSARKCAENWRTVVYYTEQFAERWEAKDFPWDCIKEWYMPRYVQLAIEAFRDDREENPDKWENEVRGRDLVDLSVHAIIKRRLGDDWLEEYVFSEQPMTREA